MGPLKLTAASPVLQPDTSRLVCPCLSLFHELRPASPLRLPSILIQSENGGGGRRHNGLENTVTFSYLTHLLLFLFQPVKSGLLFFIFIFAAKHDKVGEEWWLFLLSVILSEGHWDFILSSRRTEGLQLLKDEGDRSSCRSIVEESANEAWSSYLWERASSACSQLRVKWSWPLGKENISSTSSIFVSISAPPLSLLCLNQGVLFLSHPTSPGSLPQSESASPIVRPPLPPRHVPSFLRKDSVTKGPTAEKKRFRHSKGKRDGEWWRIVVVVGGGGFQDGNKVMADWDSEKGEQHCYRWS